MKEKNTQKEVEHMQSFIRNGRDISIITAEEEKYLRGKPSKKGLFEIIKQDDIKKELYCKPLDGGTKQDLYEWLNFQGRALYIDYDVYYINEST